LRGVKPALSVSPYPIRWDPRSIPDNDPRKGLSVSILWIILIIVLVLLLLGFFSRGRW
jgi:hypothetical protein